MNSLPNILGAESASPELWGGVECTINRVGDVYFNQLEWSGHIKRTGDLQQFASLGIRRIRYPVLWELLAPDHESQIDWSFPDERLPELRRLGIKPIAGLVHHGSGPRYAPVDSPAFAPALARFARKVAERYPWVDGYTPVNEPLTTARFCGLYGLWFPHGRNDRIFIRILLNECRAIILAMKAVREINPRAHLIQTDDLGRIYSTPRLAAEAEFQNHRRWLAWDLLCGNVDASHPLWTYLLRAGAEPRELDWFQNHRCPPDVVGINHYPTSDRFLDENLERYPGIPASGNGVETYIDTEAVRARRKSPGGFHERLMEAWERYRLPLAITESHLGCTREEQLRWFAESWQAALRAREAGADVRATTAWALLGTFNWNTLVTRDAGYYEPGVFDIRSGELRPTAIAALIRDIGRNGDRHPVLQAPGWWLRAERLHPAHRTAGTSPGTRPKRALCHRPVLILGADGLLGKAFVDACNARGITHRGITKTQLHLTDQKGLMTRIRQIRPWAIISCACFNDIQGAETDGKRCFEINTELPAHLALICRHLGASLLCFSSDLIFDGRQDTPYLESSLASPLNVFGTSKLAMEKRVMKVLPEALIVRSGLLFSFQRPAKPTRLHGQLRLAGGPGFFTPGTVVSPTYVPDLVNAAFDLLIDRASGVWHLSNRGDMPFGVFLRRAAEACDLDSDFFLPQGIPGFRGGAFLPPYRAMGTEKGQLLVHLDEALAAFGKACRGMLKH